MIGVLVRQEEREWATEFFELFKTPWEFFREGEEYPVVLTTHGRPPKSAAAVIAYGSEPLPGDRENHCRIDSRERGPLLHHGASRIPLYGQAATFRPNGRALLRVAGSARPAALHFRNGSQRVYRIGYDLFREIRHLLTSGQPPENAHYPTLELHISMLRSWILSAGVPVIEIPPSPPGTDFMVCLTHDVDFAALRMHRFDHTMAGFLYRALFGTAIDLLRGRGRWEKVIANWKAALLLPAVYAGAVGDFWNQYERYLEIEDGLKSTFYFIPFKNRPGSGTNGSAPGRRACRYDISDVKAWTSRILSKGGEIGLHGLDAWVDPRRGEEELARIRTQAGEREVGVRMHWLYFGAESPRILEEAGFLYDSTWGYNDAVGFRAGTGQVFKPQGASRLLELPLAIQDTALFYRGRMGLGEDEALERCKEVIGRFRHFGGVLVINWHHRSLGPERLWGGFYKKLLQEIGKERVLYVTAREAVHWFHSRRAAVFARGGQGRMRIARPAQGRAGHGPLALRFHWPEVMDEKSGPPRNPGNRGTDLLLEDHGSWGPGEQNVSGDCGA